MLRRFVSALVAFSSVACASSADQTSAEAPSSDSGVVEVAVPPLPAEPSPATSVSPPSEAQLDTGDELSSRAAALQREVSTADTGGGTVGSLMAGTGPAGGGRRGPSGKVTLGPPLFTGIANANAVVMGMRAGFRRCYNRALTSDPFLAGGALLVVTVGDNGEVAALKVAGTTLPKDLIACISARAKAAVFSPPEKAPATVTFPADFATESKPSATTP